MSPEPNPSASAYHQIACSHAESGQIVASALTDRDVDDASQVGPLLDQVAGAVAAFIADGAYD